MLEFDSCVLLCVDSCLLPSGTDLQRSGVLRATAAATWFRLSNITCAQASRLMVNSRVLVKMCQSYGDWFYTNHCSLYMELIPSGILHLLNQKQVATLQS